MIKKIIFIVIISLLFTACEKKTAPLNEGTVKKIFESIQKIAKKEGLTPPIESKKLIQIYIEAFSDNGYSYFGTIHEISQVGFKYNEYDYIQTYLEPYLAAVRNKENCYELFDDKDVQGDFDKVISLYLKSLREHIDKSGQ